VLRLEMASIGAPVGVSVVMPGMIRMGLNRMGTVEASTVAAIIVDAIRCGVVITTKRGAGTSSITSRATTHATSADGTRASRPDAANVREPAAQAACVWRYSASFEDARPVTPIIQPAHAVVDAGRPLATGMSTSACGGRGSTRLVPLTPACDTPTRFTRRDDRREG
jgi:hypothetical protein